MIFFHHFPHAALWNELHISHQQQPPLSAQFIRNPTTTLTAIAGTPAHPPLGLALFHPSSLPPSFPDDDDSKTRWQEGQRPLHSLEPPFQRRGRLYSCARHNALSVEKKPSSLIGGGTTAAPRSTCGKCASKQAKGGPHKVHQDLACSTASRSDSLGLRKRKQAALRAVGSLKEARVA
mmetsp:Transcript_21412/g.67209  ORF Transcript_21412/g.67209 Transcript_21412/m.67209 type:complete len:178 (-) Transcript_21412:19-552(-)